MSNEKREKGLDLLEQLCGERDAINSFGTIRSNICSLTSGKTMAQHSKNVNW
jgi:hypothetical protein